MLEGQQKELRLQWTWSKVIRTEADWKRQQMENGEDGRGGGELREVLEGQEKELRRQWARGKVIRAVADWKRQQMGMRKLEEAVENSERCWRDSRRS